MPEDRHPAVDDKRGIARSHGETQPPDSVLGSASKPGQARAYDNRLEHTVVHNDLHQHTINDDHGTIALAQRDRLHAAVQAYASSRALYDGEPLGRTMPAA